MRMPASPSHAPEPNVDCDCTHLAALYSAVNLTETLASPASHYSSCDCPEIQEQIRRQTRQTELVVLIIVGGIWIFSMWRFSR